jgi:hypothetical protein
MRISSGYWGSWNRQGIEPTYEDDEHSVSLKDERPTVHASAVSRQNTRFFGAVKLCGKRSFDCTERKQGGSGVDQQLSLMRATQKAQNERGKEIRTRSKLSVDGEHRLVRDGRDLGLDVIDLGDDLDELVLVLVDYRAGNKSKDARTLNLLSLSREDRMEGR